MTVKKRVVKRPTTLKSKAMAAYLTAARTETRVLGAVGRHLLSRPLDTSRRTDVLHPSEIIKDDWCHRASYHALNGAVVEPKRHGMQLESVFAEGHEIHAKWQRWLQEMGVLLGMWECQACYLKWWSDGTPTECSVCGRSDLIRYAEIPAVYEPWRIHGHADGGIRGLGTDLLLEIKSIGPGTIRHAAPHLLAEANGDVQKAWSQIKRPFADHIKQTQIYLEVLRLQAEAVGHGFAPTEVVFIYELKATQESKEFIVRRSTRLIEDVIDGIKDVVYAVESKQEPACNVNPEKGECVKCKAFVEVPDAVGA